MNDFVPPGSADGSGAPNGGPKSPVDAQSGALPEGAYIEDYPTGRPMLRMQDAPRGYDYRTGDAITPYGLVSVYDQGRHGDKPATRLDFVTGGRLHIATWQRVFQDRFLVTLAVRFAAKCSEGRS